jgi:metal-sulfur cluster biosynthetic enzyme
MQVVLSVEMERKLGKGFMVQDNEEVILEALREVIDPEIGLNVVELGLIRKIDSQQDQTVVTMILTTPFCPYAPAMVEQVRVAAGQAAESEVAVEVGTELWDPSMMEEGAGGDWGLF